MGAEINKNPERKISSSAQEKIVQPSKVQAAGNRIVEAAREAADPKLKLQKQIIAAYQKGDFWPDLTKNRWENHPSRATFEDLVKANFTLFAGIDSAGWCRLKNPDTGESRQFMLVVSASSYAPKDEEKIESVPTAAPVIEANSQHILIEGTPNLFENLKGEWEGRWSEFKEDTVALLAVEEGVEEEVERRYQADPSHSKSLHRIDARDEFYRAIGASGEEAMALNGKMSEAMHDKLKASVSNDAAAPEPPTTERLPPPTIDTSGGVTD